MALRHADIALAIDVLRAVPVGHPRISSCRRAIVNRAYGLDRPASIPNAKLTALIFINIAVSYSCTHSIVPLCVCAILAV